MAAATAVYHAHPQVRSRLWLDARQALARQAAGLRRAHTFVSSMCCMPLRAHAGACGGGVQQGAIKLGCEQCCRATSPVAEMG